MTSRQNMTGGAASRLSQLVVFLAAPRPFWKHLVWLAGALAASTLLTYFRLKIGLGSAGVPVVFYFPAIIVVALVAGWACGLAAVALSIAIVWFVFVPPALSFHAPSRDQIITLALWALVSALLVALAYFLRLALQELLRSEMRYRELVAVTSDIVWVTDGEGNVHAPHPAWTRVTGMPWPTYRGRTWIEAIHEEDRPLLQPTKVATDGYHMAEFRLRDGTTNDWRWFRSRAVPLTGPDGEIREWITTMRDAHDARLARERRELLIGEGRHRLKNLVTIIDALAKSSRRPRPAENPELDAFLKRFLGRLHALGAAADLVLAGNHVSVELGAVLRATLAPFTEENANRFHIEGPEVQLSEATGGSLALAVHELATNAIKYGALSDPNGSVAVGWTRTPMPDGDRIVIEWIETGGPKPTAPEREGYGGRVIKSMASREKSGEVAIEYRPDGLYCRIGFLNTFVPPQQTVAL
jgi:PAS domain S-box-containing protein